MFTLLLLLLFTLLLLLLTLTGMFTVCRMLQMEDKLKGHPLYFDAAKLAMEVSFLDQC